MIWVALLMPLLLLVELVFVDPWSLSFDLDSLVRVAEEAFPWFWNNPFFWGVGVGQHMVLNAIVGRMFLLLTALYDLQEFLLYHPKVPSWRSPGAVRLLFVASYAISVSISKWAAFVSP